MSFSLIKSGVTAVAISAAVLVSGEADAATMYEGTYEATSVTTNGNDHTVWLPGLFDGINAYWQFKPNAGKFVVGEDNGTAKLTGQIRNNVTTDYEMLVDVSYVLRNPNVPGTEVKTGGGSYDGTWSFFDITSATLTGIGDLAGLVLSLTAYPNTDTKDIPFQLGEGANDKNSGLGGAGWFSWVAEIDDTYSGPDPINSARTAAGHGDININLAPVPLPAAGMMLLAGLGGFGALRMRKRNA
ncbi:VPLPA-CTERM sorting domain-containing protein [uncultured Roseobacter sp.]|uniref:VPLPA-CTERM sorting domain-containing protein n=1 Tax=uncultured Roseobacter sp. TaxID=114847 RepID=UPI0026053FF7|nr:VPLPA-CTERM sorting domain-containing protein [uncultured Roseobacter sp.]